jgi:hypothetical protein
MRAWGEAAPDEAIDWLSSLPDSGQREAAAGSLAMALVTSAPARAQEVFGELSPDVQAQVSERVAGNMALTDAAQARTWAEALPPGKAKGVAFEAIATSMAREDAAETTKWLQGLPTGAPRDRAIKGFCSFASDQDPEGALSWALTISDAADRARAVEDLGKSWMNRDAANARKWLESAAVPPEEKERILRP